MTIRRLFCFYSAFQKPFQPNGAISIVTRVYQTKPSCLGYV